MTTIYRLRIYDPNSADSADYADVSESNTIVNGMILGYERFFTTKAKAKTALKKYTKDSKDEDIEIPEDCIELDAIKVN